MTFHLDEMEAKVYRFLETHADNAYTAFHIFIMACVEPLPFKLVLDEENVEQYLRDPRFQAIQQAVNRMERDNIIAGRYYQGNYYYAL